MLLVSSCSCLCPIHWSQVLSWEWRCSWSSADRRCSNYIWVINNFIAYQGAPYIRDFTVPLYLSGAFKLMCTSGSAITLCMRPANERRHYNVMSSLIGWALTQNDPWWICLIISILMAWCNTVISPLPMHWRYHNHEPNHQYDIQDPCKHTLLSLGFFHKRLGAHKLNLVKILFSLVFILLIRSGQHLAYITTGKLLWCAQLFPDLIIILQVIKKNCKIWIMSS